MPDEASGEFALIERIVARLGDAAARDILVPPGDDAAAWTVASGTAVATTDALVEGSHWRSDTMSWSDVGWRAIATSVSDVAAMGATPTYALVAMVLGPSCGAAELDAFVDGMAEACRCHDVRVAGGDIVSGRETVVTVTVFGSADAAGERDVALLRRDAARAGDVIAVSGYPGASAAGLAMIEAGRGGEAGFEPLLRAHRRPVARVALGRAAVQADVRCAIDVSDGLLQDAGHIAERSGAGIEIDLESLPLHPAAVEALGATAARDLALGGGDDYELALAGPADALAALATPALPVTVVGRVVAAHAGEAWAITAGGERYIPPAAGWDHLRSAARP